MDKDTLRFKRRRTFLEKRLSIWDKLKGKYPEGITKANLEEIKKEIKKAEKEKEE